MYTGVMGKKSAYYFLCELFCIYVISSKEACICKCEYMCVCVCLCLSNIQVYSQFSWTLCPYVYKVTYMYNI